MSNLGFHEEDLRKSDTPSPSIPQQEPAQERRRMV